MSHLFHGCFKVSLNVTCRKRYPSMRKVHEFLTLLNGCQVHGSTSNETHVDRVYYDSDYCRSCQLFYIYTSLILLQPVVQVHLKKPWPNPIEELLAASLSDTVRLETSATLKSFSTEGSNWLLTYI